MNENESCKYFFDVLRSSTQNKTIICAIILNLNSNICYGFKNKSPPLDVF